MKKLYLFVLLIASIGISYAQQIVMTTPVPKYGCPNTTHDLSVGVQNTSAYAIPSGYPYTITIEIYNTTPALLHTSSQVFSDAIAINGVKTVTLTGVPFQGAMTCSVAVSLAYTFPIVGSGTYNASGTYIVQFPPNLTITENPTSTIEVQTPLDGYSVRYYLNGNSTYIHESTTTTYAPFSFTGSYTAKAYDPLTACISASASNAVNISTTLSTSAAQKFNFSVYPNPMASTVTISTTLSSPLEYELTDINGVVQGAAAFNSSAQVDVSRVTTGTYLLSIKENGTLITTYKLVK